jgi:hypothetical protein
MASAMNVWSLIDENSYALTDGEESICRTAGDMRRKNCLALPYSRYEFANKWKISFSNKSKKINVEVTIRDKSMTVRNKSE